MIETAGAELRRSTGEKLLMFRAVFQAFRFTSRFAVDFFSGQFCAAEVPP